jgi:hypothetical protein
MPEVAACVAAELLCYSVAATAEWYERRLLFSYFKKKGELIKGPHVSAAAAEDAAELSNGHAVAVTAGVT